MNAVQVRSVSPQLPAVSEVHHTSSLHNRAISYAEFLVLQGLTIGALLGSSAFRTRAAAVRLESFEGELSQRI